jgi:pimeloyl-ACP methyl ester carboxylesterase
MEPEENYLDTPGGRIHYLDWGGSGPQAHLLHANGFCAGTYSPFVKYLLDDLHIIAGDVRGHGGSDLPDIHRVHHWNIFADDLKTLIDQTMSPPIIGLGHSLGAVTTYIAAATYPHLFSAIILIDPPIFPRRMLWLIAVMKWLGLTRSIPLARTARRRKKTFQSKKEALKRFASGRGIFKSWSQEFVEAYLECGLLEKDSETAVLKCDPELESSNATRSWKHRFSNPYHWMCGNMQTKFHARCWRSAVSYPIRLGWMRLSVLNAKLPIVNWKPSPMRAILFQWENRKNVPGLLRISLSGIETAKGCNQGR